MVSYALRSLLAHRRRAGLAALAVLLGVAMVAGTFVFTDTIRSAFRELFTGQAKGAEVVVSSRQGLYSATNPPINMPVSVQSRILRLPGIAAAEGQVSDVATIIGRGNKLVKNTGSPTLAISNLAPPFTGVQFVSGSPPVGVGEVALDQSTSEREGYHVGDLVPIVTGQPVRRFRVSGIARVGSVSNAGAGFAVFDIQAARELFAKPGAGRFDLRGGRQGDLARHARTRDRPVASARGHCPLDRRSRGSRPVPGRRPASGPHRRPEGIRVHSPCSWAHS